MFLENEKIKDKDETEVQMETLDKSSGIKSQFWKYIKQIMLKIIKSM